MAGDLNLESERSAATGDEGPPASPPFVEQLETTRRKLAFAILQLFWQVNSVVLAIVFMCIWIDTFMVNDGVVDASERIVNATTISALIAATTAQLGAVTVTVFGFYFTKPQSASL